MNTLILAIDQATRVSGWALVDDIQVIDFGVWKTPNKLKGPDAAMWQCDAIEEALLLKGPGVLAIEDMHINDKSHPGTIFLLGELRGMIRRTAALHHRTLEMVNTQDMCQHLGVSVFAKRPAKKRASRQSAAMDLWQDRTRWKEIAEDAADAIAIGLIVQRRLRVASMAQE